MTNTTPAEPIASSSILPLSSKDLLELPPSALTPEILHRSILALPSRDSLMTCSALLEAGTIQDTREARFVIELGLARGEKELGVMEVEVHELLGDEHQGWEGWSDKEVAGAIDKVVGGRESALTVLRCSVLLHEAKQRLDTFDALHPPSHPIQAERMTGANDEDRERSSSRGDKGVTIDDPWEALSEDQAEEDSPMPDDPWEAVGSDKSASVQALKVPPVSLRPPRSETPDPPMALSTFLLQPIPVSALGLAASAELSALKVIRDVLPAEVFPYRFAILDSVPCWVSPGELHSAGLLPRLGGEDKERPWSRLSTAHDTAFLDVIPSDFRPTASSLPARHPDLLVGEELTKWYSDRIHTLDALGLLDIQLQWVQFGASLGATGLDGLGEDLILLSRLIYDGNLSPIQQERWNLSTWKSATEGDLVNGYLSGSVPGTVVDDIRRLVLPYLYVLESRAERGGKADPQLVERLLHSAILDLPLNLALPVFEASKATVPASSRLIRNDLNVARLALACLYGSDQREVWATMSSIFECLPVWDVSGGDLEADKEATATTLDSIATFVRPARAGGKSPTAHDLFIFFSPLPFAALSRALDILDVHLESGEILARWDTAVQLRFLLQSARSTSDQTDLAERMVRRQASRGPHTDARWTSLWSDMRKLNGGDDALLRGAFGLLTVEEMMRIYVGGVLSSGKIDIAKRLIRRLETEHALSNAVLEVVVLATAREFYDNAETGNIHTGDMKRAYDCLSLVPTSVAIRKEQDFIGATSRLCSYNLSLSPIEIRHSKDRLQLIRRVLSSSDEAHRHAEIILDLTDKLGYRGDATARVEVLAMLADAAIQATEFERAFERCQAMVGLAKTRKRGDDGGSRVSEVCWKTCLQLGQQREYADVGNKMTLLGWAVELCPSEQIPDILSVWRRVEDGQIRLGEAAKRRRLTGINQPSTSTSRAGSTPSSPSRLPEAEERVLGSRTAARAARLAKDFGERFNLRQLAPSPLLGSEEERDEEGSERRKSAESERPIAAMFDAAAEGERVRLQTRRALIRGVGWLLGADEKEIAG